MDPNRSPDLARTTLQLLALAALIGTSLWIVRPFLVALIWAATVAIATWPLLLRAQSWLGGRRGLAVALMTCALTVSAIVTSCVMLKPAVRLQTVEDRAIIGLSAAGTRGNQLGESMFHLLKSLNLPLDVGDLHLCSFPHAVARVDGVDAQRQQSPDLV